MPTEEKILNIDDPILVTGAAGFIWVLSKAAGKARGKIVKNRQKIDAS